MKKLLLFFFLSLVGITQAANIDVYVSGTYVAGYATLQASFAAINAGTHTGSIDIKINTSTTETATALLYQSGYGTSSYTSIHIYPTVTGLNITGNFATPLIEMNGADNVNIDGRVNGTGSPQGLTISNTSTGSAAGTSTLRFINDATSNTVQYCTVKGSTLDATGGVIFFSTGTATGNNNNNITNNNITSVADNARPVNTIYSYGSSSTITNSGIAISNNNIYNFLNPDSNSSGIAFAANSTGATISGNSMYESTTFVPTASGTYRLIYIASGNGHIVSGNYLGGSAPNCSGIWIKPSDNDNAFYSIYIAGGASIANSIQGNTITGFNWSNSGNNSWIAIFNGGTANIGTVTGNIIGASSGTGAITVTNSSTGGWVYGIYTFAANISNNTIGSITIGNTNSTNASCFIGIYSGTSSCTISNNLIGNSTTANSIYCSSASSSNLQTLYGISVASSISRTIIGNTIANLNNGTSNTAPGTVGAINGIYCVNSSSFNIVSGNSIHDLSIANANSATDYHASVIGISFNSGTNAVTTVTGNTIYNLSNTSPSFVGSLLGIYFVGVPSGTGINTVSGNFIYGLSVSSSSVGTSLYGIKIASGNTTYANNIIYLGGSTASSLYGIYETGAANNNSYLYHNTIYISGSPTSTSYKSYALYSAATTNIRDFRNNLFINTRSTTGGSSLHYALYLAYASTSGLTLNSNDYMASGIGGMLGYYNSTDISSLATMQSTIGQDANSLNIDPAFTYGNGTTATSYFPTNSFIEGVAGTGITTDYAGATRSIVTPAMGAYERSTGYPVQIWKNAVLQGNYTSLQTAFAAINAGTHTGSLDLKINASTTETDSAQLYQSGYNGTSSYTSIHIYPTTTGLSITGNLAKPLIDLNGADNVSIDGRVNGTGSPLGLTISNTSTSSTASTSSLRFINDATSNTVQYCTISGSTLDLSGGVISFASGTTTGNNNNNITNNNITSAADNARPISVIYSSGTSSLIPNSGIVISNNNIYNFLNRGTASFGIRVIGNTNTCTISGNSMYETASFVPTAGLVYRLISIASGEGWTISGNYLGGSAANCSGTWVKTNAYNNPFYAIYISGGATTANSIQGNTITGFNWGNSGNASWYGVFNAGTANIGTVTGNIIGATSGTNAIILTNGTTGNGFFGIYTNLGTVDKNTIGAITVANSTSTDATSFYGILANGNITNNVIGNASTANSIYCSSSSSGSSQPLYGIYAQTAASRTISGNTIANLTNGTSNATAATAGCTVGIYCVSGTNTVTNNSIHDLTISNANTSTTNTLPIAGMVFAGSTYVNTVTGNTIYNLSNTYASFAGSLAGISFSGAPSGTGTNTVSGNFIYGLSVPSSAGAAIYGIKIATGNTNYANNIINLGGSTASSLYGIYETGAANNNSYLYHNTIYISGNPTSTSYKSYALYSAATTNTRDFRNNLFINTRSTTGGSSLHYALYLAYASTSGLTVNYNDYVASGTGGMLGYYNSSDIPSLVALQSAIGQNANSLNVNPIFTNVDGTSASAYRPTLTATSLIGISGTGINTDYANTTRAANPSMGAYEIPTSPTVNTLAISNIGTTTATGNGNIISLGSATNVSAYGVCWSSSSTTPTITNSYGTNGTTTSTGTFTYSMTGLTAGTTYYVRAYATNSTGTTYGDMVTFTTSSSSKQLTLKVYLQGLWNGTNMNKCKKWDDGLGDMTDAFGTDVVDTISIELHNSTYRNIAYKLHGLELHQNGTVTTTGLSYISVPTGFNGSYYVTVRTRNHLETTTANLLSFSGSAIAYDFTDASTKALESDPSFRPMAQKNGKWMLYGGNPSPMNPPLVNTDAIDSDDLYYVMNNTSEDTGLYGYLANDVNGDGVVDTTDVFDFTLPNVSAGIFFYFPE